MKSYYDELNTTPYSIRPKFFYCRYCFLKRFCLYLPSYFLCKNQNNFGTKFGYIKVENLLWQLKRIDEQILLKIF